MDKHEEWFERLLTAADRVGRASALVDIAFITGKPVGECRLAFEEYRQAVEAKERLRMERVEFEWVNK